MSLLIFIAESHDMHPNGVPCRKWGVKCSNDREKYGRKATCHPERGSTSSPTLLRSLSKRSTLKGGVEDNSAGKCASRHCEPKARQSQITLGVPLPSGKVGLYRKAARAHQWCPRAALATALRQNSIGKGPCGSTSSPTLCRRAATRWSLSLTQFNNDK